MPSEERDRQFERALQRHMRGDAACPDAETLAAYHERTLSLEEMARLKEHVAGCMRCQETLAMLEETNPIALHAWERETAPQEGLFMAGASVKPIAVTGMRELSHGNLDESLLGMPEAVVLQKVERKKRRWIVPVGALAAGLLIFVVVREYQSHPGGQQSAIQVAENREVPAPASLPGDVQGQSKPQQSAQQKVESGARLDQKTVPPEKMALPPSASSPMSKKSYDSAAKEAAKGAADALVISKEVEGAPESRKTAGMETQNRADLTAGPRAASPSPPVAKPMTGIAAGVVGGAAGGARKQSAAEMSTAKSPTSEALVVENNAPIPSSAQLSYNASTLREIAVKDSHLIVPPDGKHAWRVGAAGQIEITGDAGRTWSLQQSGVITELKAGSAPSEIVCWIVGKAGTVLLTTDGGKRWKLLGSPIKEDLGGVHAVDAQHATIWNVPNRKSFETADGGVTWTPTANE